MNLKKYLQLLAFFVMANSIGAQQIKLVNSKVKMVSIFANQAQVDREAKLNLEEGLYTLNFENISPSLILGSIEFKAPIGVELLSVSTHNNLQNSNEKPAELIVLEDSLAIILEQLLEIKADKEAIALQRELLIANKSIGGANQGVKADELEDVLSIFERKLKEFKTQYSNLNRHEKILNTQREIIELQLAEFREGRKAFMNQIWAQVKVSKPIVDAQFELRYLVGDVSWSPIYDIRVKDTKSPVQFILRANVIQNTGENWEQVKLQLSNSNPMDGGTKPELQTWFLDFAHDYGKSANAPRVNSKAPSYEPQLAKAEAYAAEAPIIQQGFLNLSFEVQGLSSIPSDANIHVIELNHFSLDAIYGLALVPKLSSDVFVTSKIQTNDLINQLNGEANIYLNGTFTGKTYLSQQVGDTLLITLGKDHRMITKREKVKDMCSKSLFGSTRKNTNTYEITISNSATDEMVVAVEDQIPVSINSDISVKLVDAGGANFKAETGKLLWTVKIPAKQSIKLRFSYEVSYPSDKVIVDY